MRRFHPQWSILGFIGVLVVIAISALPILQSTPTALAAGTITGTVFQDYNANGVKDTGSYAYSAVTGTAIDQGISSIVVSAFDATGLLGTATTAVNGTFSLAHSGTGTLRIEFSNLPAGFQPGPNAGAVTPDGSPAGVIRSGTLVQFVAATGTANLGLIRPEEYCQNNPQLAYSCYRSGDALAGGTTGTTDSLFTIPYSASGTTPAPTPVAKGAQIGAVWGEAWQRETKQLFTAAFVKRHVGLGTLGTGGIYVTNLSTGTPATSPYIDVQTLGIDTGSFAAARGLPANDTAPSTDVEAFAHVGKLGIGSIALSDDDATLWLTNLKNRTLYSIAIGNPAKATAALVAADVTAYAATAPWLTASPCTNGVARPFGVKYYRGKVYVGVVCTAELAGGTRADLNATVYALDPVTSVFTTVINFSLDFQRGVATDRVPASNQWFPWIDTYSDAAFRPTVNYTGGATAISDCCSGLQIARPMPLLTDLEFDSSGALILGFGDRDSHQFGNGHRRPVAGDTGLLLGTTGGDILRACPNISGTYILESNGSCGGQAGGGVGNGEGPGNGEFYSGDNYLTPNHQETSYGGLSYLPGSQQTVMSGSDPSAYNSGGVYWMNNSTGNSSQRYQAYLTSGTSTFGKAAGLGDVLLLCDAAPIEIGNRIWRDDNGDGVQDPSEPGIAGATVNLYAPDGTTVLATAVTDTTGNYYFSSASGTTTTSARYAIAGLTPNTSGYTVRLDNATNYAVAGPLAGALLSPADVGANSQDQRDSDATTVGGFPRIPITTGTPGANNHSYDVGFFQPVAVGDFVWYDINANGVQDGGESGLAGVTVTLYDASGTTQITIDGSGAALSPIVTPASGAYSFGNLPPGQYTVKFTTIPAGYLPTLTGQGTSATDSNGLSAQSVVLTSGQTDPTLDAGFFQPASLGDYIWLDTNKDGVQDASESGVPGVTVTLYTSTGTQVGTPTTTGPSGDYQFIDLVPGDYFVQFNLPAGYARSPQDAAADTLDSDADVTTGRSPITTLAPGENDPSWDAGIYFTASLGDRVWLDRNANGIQDAGEPGVPGATVTLYTGTGTQVGVPITTDSNGNYAFPSLPPGDYYIQFTPPAGYVISPSDQGANDTVDSDADAISGRTVTTTITPGESDPTWDAGLYQLVSLGNLIWNDINNNGTVDGGESGIDSVVVNLYRDANGNGQIDSGEFVATQNTSGGGLYLFANLVPDSYLVQLDPANFSAAGVLLGYASSTGRIGTNLSTGGPYEPAPGPDNDVDLDDNGSALSGQGLVSAPITLTSGGEPANDGDTDPDSNLTIDFGVFQPASVGSIVWFDTDKDGVRDAGELGVPGVTVTLYDSNGSAIATTTTDANGGFQFTDLPPGTYSIGFGALPPGYTFTPQDQGGNDSSDSDADPATGRTGSITLVPGQNNPTVNAGIVVTPTAIALASFTAMREGNQIVVRWVTTAEINTWGFHLYRSTDGKRVSAVRVTPQIIPGQGRGQGGASYSWIDTDMQEGVTYTYWLVETEVGGMTNEYGPATASVRSAEMTYRLFVPLVTR